MTAYNVVSRTAMAAGQPEDISVVLANFDALATLINGNLDNSNINAAAAIAASKLAGYPADITQIHRGDGTWNKLWVALAGSGAAANQDLAVPAGGGLYYTFNTAGGGTLRSIGIPSMGAGTRVCIRNGTGSTFTVKHNLAGGTGAVCFLRALADLVLANGEAIDFLYDGTNWTEQSRDVAVSAGPGAPVTSLPGSPTTDQQVILTDNVTTPTYAWLLQWNASAAKWFFIGGSPIASYATAGLASNVAPGASYVAYTGAPSVTVPRAGVYTVRHGAGISQNTTTITTNVTVKNGANAASDIDSVELQNIPTANGAATVAKTTQFTCAASAALAHQWKNSSGNATIINAFIEATPVYVT